VFSRRAVIHARFGFRLPECHGVTIEYNNPYGRRQQRCTLDRCPRRNDFRPRVGTLGEVFLDRTIFCGLGRTLGARRVLHDWSTSP